MTDMPNSIVVTLDDLTAGVALRACACGKPREVLITTTVYRDGEPLAGAGSVQTGCYGYADIVFQAVLEGAVKGGYTVELEDNVGAIPDDDPFDGPDGPEHDQ